MSAGARRDLDLVLGLGKRDTLRAARAGDLNTARSAGRQVGDQLRGVCLGVRLDDVLRRVTGRGRLGEMRRRRGGGLPEALNLALRGRPRLVRRAQDFTRRRTCRAFGRSVGGASLLLLVAIGRG